MSRNRIMTKEEIYMFLTNKAIYYRNTESLICSLQNYDPMLDVTFFVGEAYLKFTSSGFEKKIKNELVLSKAFHNFVIDVYRKEFSTWKVRKVENINLIFSDHERKIMDTIGFTLNEKYLYAYITGKSTCFRLGLKFLRNKDGKICKFKLCRNLKELIIKLGNHTNLGASRLMGNDCYFFSYIMFKDKNHIDFIKKNGKISKSLETSFYKKFSKKVFKLIESGEIYTL